MEREGELVLRTEASNNGKTFLQNKQKKPINASSNLNG
jgi:hypothetical protein